MRRYGLKRIYRVGLQILSAFSKYLSVKNRCLFHSSLSGPFFDSGFAVGVAVHCGVLLGSCRSIGLVCEFEVHCNTDCNTDCNTIYNTLQHRL